MCGIFGLIIKDCSKYPGRQLNDVISKLFILSETRGKESAGIAIRINHTLFVYKEPQSASKMIQSKNFKKFLSEVIGNCKINCKQTQGPIPVSIIGHSRLVTNGQQFSNFNNQPVVKDGIVAVHNGIIVNEDILWKQITEIKKEYDVDTEVFLALLEHHYSKANSLISSIQETYKKISGAASVGVIFSKNNSVVIASNTGSLFLCNNFDSNLLAFASEKNTLEQLVSDKHFKDLKFQGIQQIKAGTGYLIYPDTLECMRFSLNAENYLQIKETNKDHFPIKIIDSSPVITNFDRHQFFLKTNPPVDRIKRYEKKINKHLQNHNNIKRCNKCLLPETFPFIEFDSMGVCNYCKNYKPINYLGRSALESVIEKFRSSEGEPDCLVGFSGGRDSSYMLHYIKKILKMSPIAFSYDWGMVTDLARRNQSRLCGELGIEHIIISADIEKKRRNIRANIHAWFKKPELGLVPLLMAGDKQMFNYHPYKLMNQTGIKLFFNGSNRLEKTGFKLGFCGINEVIDSEKGQLYTGISLKNKIQLAMFYSKNYIINPSYINSSFFDTFHAYYTSYFIPDISTYFYNYIPWDENEIISTLKSTYDWEVATDTKATWRIGDGTAAFYDYIYYCVAGFSEFDTFRSNQIREGIVTREEALSLVQKENIPRVDSLAWYANTIGFDLDEALDVIHSIPKLYDKNG